MVCRCSLQQSFDTSLSLCYQVLASSQRICGAIRRLRIVRSNHPPILLHPAPNSLGLLLGIMDLLRSLQVMHCADCRLVRHEASPVPQDRITNERTLVELRSCYAGKQHIRTRTLLPLFRAIDTLTIIAIGDEDTTTPQLPAHLLRRRPTTVQNLRILCALTAGDVKALLSELAPCLDLTTLDTLELWRSTFPAAPFFSDCARSLRRLVFHADLRNPVVVPQTLPLRSLTIIGREGVTSMPSPPLDPAGWRYLSRDAGALQHDELEDLRLVLRLYEYDDAALVHKEASAHLEALRTDLRDKITWAAFDDVTQRCPRLRRLRFTLEIMPHVSSRSVLARNMPRARDVLWAVASAQLGVTPRSVLEVDWSVYNQET